jgi:predicted NAD/FAD-binding protein
MEEKKATVSYIPAVKELLPIDITANKRLPKKKVLVVGGGCAGLAAAWHLNRAQWDVTLMECEGKMGGHANTIEGEKLAANVSIKTSNDLTHFVNVYYYLP